MRRTGGGSCNFRCAPFFYQSYINEKHTYNIVENYLTQQYTQAPHEIYPHFICANGSRYKSFEMYGDVVFPHMTHSKCNSGGIRRSEDGCEIRDPS